MYKFIIIDDEVYAADELSQMIEWENLDFELAGVFTDGEEALTFLESNNVDMILSDIKMPGVSGIDIARSCKEKYPDTFVVLMSAYRDFEYARTAIQFDVKRYLLKPVSYVELENTFREIRDLLDENNRSIRFREDEILTDRQALFSLIAYGTPPDNIDQCLEAVGVMSNSHDYPTLLINIRIANFTHQLKSEWKYGKESLYNAINNFICPEDRHAYYVVLSYSFDNILIVRLSKSANDDLEQNTKEFIEAVTDNLKKYLNLEVSIDVRQRFDNLMGIMMDEQMPVLAERCVRTVFSYIANNKTSEAESVLKSISEKYGDNIDFVRLLCSKLCMKYNSISEPERNISVDPANMTYDECISFIKTVFDELVLQLGEIDSISDNRIIKRAISYIKEHCGEEITQEDVANYVAFNTNYFSVYFKKHTGEKFVDYLTMVRMEKAIELMKNEKKLNIQELCFRVGYNSIPHFYKIFKAYTGLTPAEYRKKAVENK